MSSQSTRSSSRDTIQVKRFDPSYFLFVPGSGNATWGTGRLDMYDREYDGATTVEIAKGIAVPVCEVVESVNDIADDLDGFIVGDDVCVEEERNSEEEDTESEWDEADETDEEEDEVEGDWE